MNEARAGTSSNVDWMNESLSQNNAYLWNFLPRCSKKRSTKSFILVRVWDTNNSSSVASRVFKIGKVVDRDSRNRIKIQLYRLNRRTDEEWQKVETTKYFIQGVLQDDV